VPNKDFLQSDFPLAFAHRGGILDFPENSLRAFKGAYDLGFRYMETDVHTTKDGQLVAFHDDKLDRVTNSRGKVSEFNLSDLSHALIDGTEPIPLLIELLEEFPDAKFNIDPKHDAAVKPLAEIILRTNSTNRVCVGSFSDERIKQVAKLIGPELCTGMGPKSISKLQISRFTKSLLRPPFGDCAQVPSKVKGVPFITSEFVKRAHDFGKAVHAWTINDPQEIEYLLDIGVDGIMTDNLSVLKTVYLDRGIWIDRI
tara:strand:+ start:32836 stop:33603 length:768 start_codon:yes stop_codon:yes gene_type:complete